LRDNIGSHIPNDVIEYNRVHNPDGFGLAWRNGGKLLYKKFGPKEWDAFHKLLKQVDKMDVVYAAHWRFATHGAPCAELSHPYEYRDRDGKWNLLFHNGIIEIKTQKGESDTLAFVKGVVSNLSHDWYKDSAIRWAIEGAIGWSRILIMNNKSEVLLNRSAWITEGGVKYSTTPIVKVMPLVNRSAVMPPYTLTPGVVALPSGFAMPEEDEDEAKIADGLITHCGHPIELEPVGTEDAGWGMDEEYGDARCLVCDIEGSYIHLDGKVYVDLHHRSDKI
jgi:hypothetical protein